MMARFKAMSFGVLALALMLSAARADTLSAGARAYSDERYTHSARLLLPRAERGDPLAQTYVGVMYLRGEGVPQDFKQAAYWLKLAAHAGVPAAQYFLGDMYDRGLGVPVDPVLAQAWLILAVAHADSYWRGRWVKIRDAVASKMTRADLDEAQQLALGFHATVER